MLACVNAGNSQCEQDILEGNTHSYWIGARLKVPTDCHSSYFWTRSFDPLMAVTYTNWLKGEHSCEANNKDGVEGCIAILYPSGQWNDAPCPWTQCALCQV